MPTIGTLNENPLHAALKERYARPGGGVEVKRHGIVVDVAREDVWIEIQTSNVWPIKRKLVVLADHHPVWLARRVRSAARHSSSGTPDMQKACLSA